MLTASTLHLSLLDLQEAAADAQDELARARARVAELEQLCYPQALVEEDQLRWAAAVALADTDGLWDHEELRERRAEREQAKKERHALEMERTMRRLKAMTESARTGKVVTLYFGDGRAPLPVPGLGGWRRSPHTAPPRRSGGSAGAMGSSHVRPRTCGGR